MTDDEFIFLSYPQERLIWDGLFRRARLAEYDPKRFRKLFGHEYTPDQMLTERKRWTVIAQQQEVPKCVEAWQSIEQALQYESPPLGSRN